MATVKVRDSEGAQVKQCRVVALQAELAGDEHGEDDQSGHDRNPRGQDGSSFVALSDAAQSVHQAAEPQADKMTDGTSIGVSLGVVTSSSLAMPRTSEASAIGRTNQKT